MTNTNATPAPNRSRVTALDALRDAMEGCNSIADNAREWAPEQVARQAHSVQADCAIVDECYRSVQAERDRLRAALDDCANRARRIMGSIGYQEDDNAAWIGPDMHAIVDHANRAEMRESAAEEGVKP